MRSKKSIVLSNGGHFITKLWVVFAYSIQRVSEILGAHNFNIFKS